jgi:hypothetical protein
MILHIPPIQMIFGFITLVLWTYLHTYLPRYVCSFIINPSLYVDVCPQIKTLRTPGDRWTPRASLPGAYLVTSTHTKVPSCLQMH